MRTIADTEVTELHPSSHSLGRQSEMANVHGIEGMAMLPVEGCIKDDGGIVFPEDSEQGVEAIVVVRIALVSIANIWINIHISASISVGVSISISISISPTITTSSGGIGIGIGMCTISSLFNITAVVVCTDINTAYGVDATRRMFTAGSTASTLRNVVLRIDDRWLEDSVLVHILHAIDGDDSHHRRLHARRKSAPYR